VSTCRHLVVENVNGRGCGRLKKTWRECVKKVKGMAKWKLSVMDTHERAEWMSGIPGNRLTRAVAWKNDVER
jgi:viroplasmin and RNaseH domain-containing protein